MLRISLFTYCISIAASILLLVTYADPKNVLLLLFFIIIQVTVCAQNLNTFGFKAGLNFTNQGYSNIPTRTIIHLNNKTDTLIDEGGGHYNRPGISLMLYYEIYANRNISLIMGGGYRQRGFIATTKYNRNTTGYVDELSRGYETNNRFDNLFVDAAVKIRRYRRGEWVTPYAMLGNRLDCLVHFKSDFWGEDYRNLTLFEYSPVFSGGVEIPIGTYLGSNKEKIGKDDSCLTLEIEFNPGIMKVHVDEFGPGSLQVGGIPPRPNPYGSSIPVQKYVVNSCFGINAGIKF